MQDRFKFRCWDNINGKWMDCIQLDIDTGYITGFYNPEQAQKRRYILMQCTGLKDKNGKLIYEGDIVKDDKDLLYLVEFHEHAYTTSFSLKRIENPNYYPHIITYCGLGYKNRKDYEVIGNIYENKDLLNG